MKTLNQIFRYTSDCRFPDEDWQKVLAYCRQHFKGGKIHKAINPKSGSTYDQFCEWIESGIGVGDLVSYGNTMGVVSVSTPSVTRLGAYCDFEGNLIVNSMDILEPERLTPLDESRSKALKELIFQHGLDFYVRAAKFDKIYTPEKYFYVTVENPNSNEPNVGMFLESVDSKYYFVAYLNGNKLQLNCCIDSDCTPLRCATEADIKRLHKATKAAGLVFNERSHKFIRPPKKGHDNIYWYMNDRFELVMDRDNNTHVHISRWEAGNYFTEHREGAMFIIKVKKLRGKE